MEPIDLPADMDLLGHYYMLNWEQAPVIEPNLDLLKQMARGRSRQSETSRKRQNFISGMAVYRMGGDEKTSKRTYLEEWEFRFNENEW